jgi:hypothetical protein
MGESLANALQIAQSMIVAAKITRRSATRRVRITDAEMSSKVGKRAHALPIVSNTATAAAIWPRSAQH